ncbi:MAG: alkaline phosphatase family protein [Thermoplasmata archaeon]
MRPALVLLVLDGLGDRPHPDTGGATPIEAAATPHLDTLAQGGTLGDLVVVGEGVAPESDAGVFALLGYDPIHDSPGRGILEALGADVPLGPDDIALRMNFATVDGDGTVVDSRVGRSLSTTESRLLAARLTSADLLAAEGVRAEVRATVGHRGVLWLHPTRDGPLSSEISNADPFYEKVGGMGMARRPDRATVLRVEALDGSAAAARSADAMNRFLERVPAVLSGDPVNARRAIAGKKLANAILARNAGALPSKPLPTFEARYGLAGAALTEMPVERGIARTLGFADRYVGPMGPDRDAGYRERARIARELLSQYPFVYVHLKGPDEPGHDGDALGKKGVVEAIDRSFFGPFLEGLDLSQTRIAVTADHATPCILRAHSADPVPFLLAGAGVVGARSPAPVKFGESAASKGALGRRRGADVVPFLLRPPGT